MPLTKAEIDARSYRKHHKTRLRKAANYRLKKAVTRARIRGLAFDWRVLTRLAEKATAEKQQAEVGHKERRLHHEHHKEIQ
jgi:hypothetical protein